MQSFDKNAARLKRAQRGRVRIHGTASKPRVTVFRSLNHIYAQAIDDEHGATLVATSTRAKDMREQVKGIKKREQAKLIGKHLAELCKAKGIEQVVFDRSGYKYHGRVKFLADGAREGGLKF